MKRLLALLLIAVLLAGCTPVEPVESTVVTEPTTEGTEGTEPLGPALYEVGSALEQETSGAVRAYPLEGGCDGVLLMGDEVLLYFPGEHTQLNTYVGEELNLRSTTVRYPQMPADGTMIQVTEYGLSYYSKGTNTLVILNNMLQEKASVSIPMDAQGIPVVNQQMDTIYYCTSEGIRAMDLETGVAQLLRQQTSYTQGLTQECFDGEMLVCVTTDETGITNTAFIMAEDGLQVGQDDEIQSVDTYGDLYFLTRGVDGNLNYHFGTRDQAMQVLVPADPQAQIVSVLELGGVLTVGSADGAAVLDFYDLATGMRSASVTLTGVEAPRDFVADPQGYVWFLAYDPARDADVLCRWEVAMSPSSDETVYTTLWYTSDAPDTDGLAQCQITAQTIAEKYGVELRIWEDAVTAPWDDMEAEFRVEAFEKALNVVDSVLTRFPEGFFTELGGISDSEKVSISLVGDAGTENGQQDWYDGSAYISVEMGDSLETTLYRMLYRVIDTYVLGENSMLDGWDAAKPAEDRAELFEYAMTEGMEDHFADSYNQQKLRTLCRAIRDAFDMDRYDSELPWEQYLDDPLY